ncbi:SRPBCC family protein [Nonomuraea sp. NPDC050790]|uniref:SRPBCC family protein n=1 Tax=Nonomuraea sp. NPDC050790 TaxID=3364371 RepID=UPI0037B168E6
MSKPQFVYITYIRTTPERLWQALTDPAFTRRYWGVTFDTDWAVGSPMTWEENGRKTSDPAQVVLESDPYRRLAYTWHTFTPEWAEGAGVSQETLAAISAEPRTKVSFDLEQVGETVKLTVIHDGFAPDSTLLGMISEGWPSVLSGLKTLLETGEPLPSS